MMPHPYNDPTEALQGSGSQYALKRSIVISDVGRVANRLSFSLIGVVTDAPHNSSATTPPSSRGCRILRRFCEGCATFCPCRTS